MKPATTIAGNGAFSVQKSIFEFALRARKITIPGALATQFHEIYGLTVRSPYLMPQRPLLITKIKTTGPARCWG
ncbi:MAG: hypothetical protein ACK5GN_12570 [Pseudomonadota bacterium]|jgi:hypothetical protein